MNMLMLTTKIYNVKRKTRTVYHYDNITLIHNFSKVHGPF